jgi:hypothetical protein
MLQITVFMAGFMARDGIPVKRVGRTPELFSTKDLASDRWLRNKIAHAGNR